jgi:hypothetical protein
MKDVKIGKRYEPLIVRTIKKNKMTKYEISWCTAVLKVNYQNLDIDNDARQS